MKKSKRRQRILANNREQCSVEALLSKPNPWTEWMRSDIPMWGSMRFAALLLRDVPVPTVVNLLAPALEEANCLYEQRFINFLEQGRLEPGEIVTFAGWLELHGDPELDMFDQAVTTVVRQIGGSPDAELFSAMADDEDVDEILLLYLLMNGIKHWSSATFDKSAVHSDNLWLAELETHEEEMDGLAMLYAHFYNRFRDAGHFPCERLPLQLEVVTKEERDLFYDDIIIDSSPDEIDRAMQLAFDDARQVLPDVLGEDGRSWPRRAKHFQELQRRRRRPRSGGSGSGNAS